MSFETLLYIHTLLKREEGSTRHAYESHRERLAELKDLKSSREEIDLAKRAMESADRLYCNAIRALSEFMEHDWR